MKFLPKSRPIVAVAIAFFAVAGLSLSVALAAPLNVPLNLSNPAATTAKKCMQACATKLVACFVQSPNLLAAPTDPLDACRSKANSCVTACNVPNSYTVGCEDRCATVLQGCMAKAASDADKTACHKSNKACLIKACSITASQLASDYCSKQCGRASDICTVSGGMAGVSCPTVKTACVNACPASARGSAALGGTGSFFGSNRMQLKTDFNTILNGLRTLNFNFKSYSASLNQWSSQSCPEAVVACKKMYKACSATADQELDQKLMEGMNACVQTCEEEPADCFGVAKKVCVTGQSASCACENKVAGIKTCKSDGSGYGVCACAPAQNCSPKTTAECTCATGAKGKMTCKDDGSGYGACGCTSDATPPPPPPNPPPTPQNCYVQGSNPGECEGTATNYMYLCALQYPSGNWWTGSFWTGCVNTSPVCPCPTTPPVPGTCAAGAKEVESCSDPVSAPQGGWRWKRCQSGAWVSDAGCTAFPVCDPNIPNQGQCIQQ